MNPVTDRELLGFKQKTGPDQAEADNVPDPAATGEDGPSLEATPIDAKTGLPSARTGDVACGKFTLAVVTDGHGSRTNRPSPGAGGRVLRPRRLEPRRRRSTHLLQGRKRRTVPPTAHRLFLKLMRAVREAEWVTSARGAPRVHTDGHDRVCRGRAGPLGTRSCEGRVRTHPGLRLPSTLGS